MLSLLLGEAPGRTVSLFSSRTQYAREFTSPSEFPTFSLFYFITHFWLCGLHSPVDCFLAKQYVAWRVIIQPGLGYLKKSWLKSHDKTRFCSCIFERISIKMETQKTSQKCKPIKSSVRQIHIESSKVN